MRGDSIVSTDRVVANYGSELVLMDQNGQFRTATPTKKLGLLVCGDLVTCQLNDGVNRVTNVEARTSTLARTDRQGREKAIAANITQLVAVTAPKPPFDPLLIDQYAIAANHIDVDLAIIINKTDLLDDTTARDADELEKIYSEIGYQVIRHNNTATDTTDLHAHLSDQVSILVGQSGVGKSSLLKQLLPDEDIKTGALSKLSGLGRHTTTVTTWFELPNGGAIIDSAGVRQFSLDHLSEVDTQAGFKEISKLSEQCKFNDCKHIHEPQCAVLDALTENRIAQLRYDNYLQMREPKNL